MTNRKKQKPKKKAFDMPSAEKVRAELSKAESMDDFFGKEGIFSNLFAETLEQMLEAELSRTLEAFDASAMRRPEAVHRYLMGLLMDKLLGRVEGARVARHLDSRLEAFREAPR